LQYKNLVINQKKNIHNISRVIATAKNKNITNIDKFIEDIKNEVKITDSLKKPLILTSHLYNHYKSLPKTT